MKVLDTPVRVVNRPRMRSVGLVHVVAAATMAPLLVVGELKDCAGTVRELPTAALLTLVVAVAGVVMLVRTPRASAVAPAASAGASMSLLGAAAAGWIWIFSQPCVGDTLDREAVTLLFVTAGAAATLGTSLWLLYARDELEPWYATRGVVLSSAAAVLVLVGGLGFAFLAHDPGETPVVITAAATTVPWAVAVALTGWLRPSPAVAVVLPASTQALLLVLA